MGNPWIRSWSVVGTSKKTYKVSQRQDGTFGCECQTWMFQKAPKEDCQHILKKKIELFLKGDNTIKFSFVTVDRSVAGKAEFKVFDVDASNVRAIRFDDAF